MSTLAFADAVTTASSVTATDVSAIFELVSGVSQAVSEGNYFWLVSILVYAILELLRGELPGTDIRIPGLPQFLSKTLSPTALKGIAAGCSAVLAVIFIIANQPLDQVVVDAALGWIGAMGLHDGADILKDFVSNLRSKRQS